MQFFKTVVCYFWSGKKDLQKPINQNVDFKKKFMQLKKGKIRLLT